MKLPSHSKQALRVCIVIIVCITIFGCSMGASQKGISKEDAIRIASERVQKDGVMSLTDRTPVVIEEQEQWHVYFLLPENMVGGEPHIFIDKKTGAITEVYYTQ